MSASEEKIADHLGAWKKARCDAAAKVEQAKAYCDELEAKYRNVVSSKKGENRNINPASENLAALNYADCLAAAYSGLAKHYADLGDARHRHLVMAKKHAKAIHGGGEE